MLVDWVPIRGGGAANNCPTLLYAAAQDAPVSNAATNARMRISQNRRATFLSRPKVYGTISNPSVRSAPVVGGMGGTIISTVPGPTVPAK
jgi:hypothetical protein